jgi:cytoskeletal protein CcmA (bactofilin family)
MWEAKKRNDSPSDAGNFTVLGKDVRFKGVVHFEGTVQLDGCFEGEIHTTGILVVGEHAVIRGTLTVCTLISGGKIHGQVTATDKVQLLKSAVHIGDVQSPAFLIEAGAYFKGRVDMGKSPWEDESLQQVAIAPDHPLPRHKPRPRLLEHGSTH